MQPQRRRDAEEDAEKRGSYFDHLPGVKRDEPRDPLTEKVIGACIEVHRELGPGLTEDMYEEAVCHEFDLVGIRYQRQVPMPVFYKGKSIGKGRVDLVVEGTLIVELKAIEQLTGVHKAQIICYLRAMKLKIGLLVNFNVVLLKDGVKRVIQST